MKDLLVIGLILVLTPTLVMWAAVAIVRTRPITELDRACTRVDRELDSADVEKTFRALDLGAVDPGDHHRLSERQHQSLIGVTGRVWPRN
jgi:hypothetical protein